ncbi:MAG TPA: carboxypeptidase-like regulatory domain-containing protein, partial [Bryobacteraceae bacterium]
LAALSILGPIAVAVFTSSSTYGRPQANTGSPGSAPRIRGHVVEEGAGQPIGNAEVSLYFLGPERPRIRTGLAQMAKAAAAESDSGGAFEFKPKELGFYAIAVTKEGYSADSGAHQEVTLTSAEPIAEIRLSLVRAGRIAGIVTDEGTGKPVAGVKLKAWDARMLSLLTTGRGAFYGRPNFGAGREAITNVDGEFTIPEVIPGKYVVEVSPKALFGERLLSKFSEDDLKQADSDYEHTYWPGGHGADASFAAAVVSGASVDIGRITVRKVEYHRVHVRIPPATCTPSDKLMVYEQSGSYQLAIADDAPCTDMLIGGFPPGASSLILATRGSKNTRLMASVPLVIGDENIQVTAPLARGLALDGKFIHADGAAPDLSNARISLRADGMIPFADLLEPAKPDSAGKFSFIGIAAVNQKVTVSGLRAGDYVKEILYNGAPIEAGVLALGKGAMSQSLTVVVDDKAATVTGVVKDGDTVVSQPFVLVASWPLSANHSFEPVARTIGDAKGAFQMTGIAPGEYRVLAVPSMEEYSSRAPGVLERALATAEKLDLGPRGFRNITLEPTRLR